MSIIFEFITKSIPDYDNEKHVLRKIYQVLENALRGGIMGEWIVRLRKETTALHVGLVDKWIAGFWSAESAMTYQPRATPWETSSQKGSSPEGACHKCLYFVWVII